MKVAAVTISVVLLCSVNVVQAVSALRNGIVRMEVGDVHTSQVHHVNPITQLPQDTRQNILVNGDEKLIKNVLPAGADENEDTDVVIDLDISAYSVGPMFVGVTLDSSIFRREWETFNTSSKQLQSLAKGLAPSFLRVGGSAADFLIFKTTAVPEESVPSVDYNTDYDFDIDRPVINNYTVTGTMWEQLNNFIQMVGWDLIFDFNQFLRKGNMWDCDNARKLLRFSQEHNFSIAQFQLGNEPNSYHHNFNFSIPGSRLAKDMQQLRSLLSEFPAYRNCDIIGPDVTKVTEVSARRYLEDFLTNDGAKVVAAVTLHHYYFNAKEHGASVQDFINITILNSLTLELSVAKSITQALAPELPLWFSETSSVSGGGLVGVSDGYAAGFMWLDKLGLSAKSGLKAVFRQTFFKGSYALIASDFTPYPDYFLTVLYKRLVQGPVFNVTSSTDAVRMYAGCASPFSYPNGALTVYVLNVRNESTTLNFTQFVGHRYDLYLLTPGDGRGLRSPFVALNGEKLVMVDGELPPLRPLICTGRITFPAYSFGFVVIPQAGVPLCNRRPGFEPGSQH